MASPPPAHTHGDVGDANASSTAVCCMCGDPGLEDELFRCRCCRARLQHRYCSDLYPRAAAYRRCNWCLREPAAADHRRGGNATAAAASGTKTTEAKRRAPAAAAAPASSDEGCSRSRPSAGLGRPVKKHRAAEEKPPPSPPTPTPAPTPAAGKGKAGDSAKAEVMRAGNKLPVHRVGRVRRYKLLAEVISC